MTLGDAALKHEVLSLFHAHVALLTEKMRRRDPAAVPALAHTLKGSALGIGARKVARAHAFQQCPAEQAAMLRLDRAVEVRGPRLRPCWRTLANDVIGNGPAVRGELP